MAKRWKLIRSMLASVGYTSIESAEGVTITDIDADGYIYYTDENGNEVKALYNSELPIAVDTDTAEITIAALTTPMASGGTTQQISITNEDGLDVTSEIATFTSSDTDVLTVSSTGLVTAISGGTAYIEVKHQDWISGDPVYGTASGVTNTVTVS